MSTRPGIARTGGATRRAEPETHGRAWKSHALHACSLLFPSVLALLLTFLALYPLAFVPSERLTATLASLVGGGLSFASVSFTAARACAEQRLHAARLIAAGSRLLRFAVITALALGLATTRERLATQLGPGFALDVPLRVLAGGVTTAAIALAFSGFRTLVLLLGPELEVEAARHLRQLLAGGAPAKGAAPEPGGRE